MKSINTPASIKNFLLSEDQDPKSSPKMCLRLWLKASTIKENFPISDDTVRRRRMPWCDEPVPHKIRFKNLQLERGEEPRHYVHDVLAIFPGLQGFSIPTRTEVKRFVIRHPTGDLVTIRSLAQLMDVHPDTISRRRVDWVEEQIIGRIRSHQMGCFHWCLIQDAMDLLRDPVVRKQNQEVMP